MNTIQKMFDWKVVRAEKVALIFEKVHLKRFFKHYRVDCVFDVGANHGQYATMLRTELGYTGHIISFEPMPRAAEILRKKSFSDPKWHIEECALDAQSGTAVFHIMKSDQFSSLHNPSADEVTLFKNDNVVSEEVTVTTATLKDMYEKYKKLLGFTRPFLKMDTQGHDMEIAKGSQETLQSFVGLQSELSIKKIYADTADYTQVIAYYTSCGFELSAFVPNNEGHFPRLIEIDCIMYNTNFN